MKILFIHHGEVPGGAPTSLKNTIIGLKAIDDKINIKVLCLNDRMQSYFRINCGVETGVLPYPCKTLGKFLIGWTGITKRNIRKLIGEFKNIQKSINDQSQIIRDESPDIVHLNSAILFTSAIAAKRLNIPVVWHIREIVQCGIFGLRRSIARKLILKNANRIIAITEAEKRSLGNHAKIDVVYNFVDFNIYDEKLYSREEARKKIGIDDEVKVVLSLGGLSWRKGSLELIKGMNYVRGNVKLILLGADATGPLVRSRLTDFLINTEDFLIDAGLKKRITWKYDYRLAKVKNNIDEGRILIRNHVENVISYILSSDLVAATYNFPHSARPVFEAWALKKPVIAFRNSGVSEIISENIDGLIVDKVSAKKLGEKINSFFLNKGPKSDLGENGFLKASSQFNQSINVNKVHQIYLRILSKKKSQSHRSSLSYS